jgi:hypothetical protein
METPMVVVAVEAAVDAGLDMGRTASCGWGAARATLLLLPPPAEPAVRAWPLLLLPLAEWGVA